MEHHAIASSSIRFVVQRVPKLGIIRIDAKPYFLAVCCVWRTKTALHVEERSYSVSECYSFVSPYTTGFERHCERVP